MGRVTQPDRVEYLVRAPVAAVFVGVRQDTLRQWVHRGKVQRYVLGGAPYYDLRELSSQLSANISER